MTNNIDLVCGMKVEEEKAIGTAEYLGKTYYFCSEDCLQKFNQKPESYMIRTGVGASGTLEIDSAS